MTGSPIAMTAGILSLLTGTVMLVVSVLFGKRYAERKKRTLLLLTTSRTFLAARYLRIPAWDK